MSKSEFTVQDDKKTLVVKRSFKATKSAVWSAYSEAEKLAKWWGPKGWTTEVLSMDFKVGGFWLYKMTCRDESQGEWFNQSSCGKGVYDMIQPEDTFAYTDYFTDENGVETPGMPASRTVTELVENDGKTTVTCTTDFGSEEALSQVMAMGMQEGFDQTWDNLETFLTSAK